MAREATKVELYGANRDGEPRSYTIASAALIAKGTYMKFADPRTASASTGSADAFAGIAIMQKTADYSTTISLWTDGIFEGTASGTITAKDAIQTAAPGNYVQSIPVYLATLAGWEEASAALFATLGAATIGYALEDAADGEAVTFRINI